MNEPEKKKENDDSMTILLLVVAGLVGVSGMFLPNIELAVFSLALGMGLMFIGVLLAFNFIRVSEKRLKKLKENKRGALWIWAVALLAIVTLAIGWFALTWPAFMLIEQIEGVYDFPAETIPAINLIKAVMGWFLILMTLGLLLWAYVNSQRREDVTYPVGY